MKTVKRVVEPKGEKKKSIPVVVVESPFGQVGVLKSDFERATALMRGEDGAAFTRVLTALCGGRSPGEMPVFSVGISSTDAAFRDGARVFLQLVLSLKK